MKEEKEKKEVQDRVHNQVGHREGKIEVKKELRGYEVFGRVMQVEVGIVTERVTERLMEKREDDVNCCRD